MMKHYFNAERFVIADEKQMREVREAGRHIVAFDPATHDGDDEVTITAYELDGIIYIDKVEVKSL